MAASPQALSTVDCRLFGSLFRIPTTKTDSCHRISASNHTMSVSVVLCCVVLCCVKGTSLNRVEPFLRPFLLIPLLYFRT